MPNKNLTVQNFNSELQNSNTNELLELSKQLSIILSQRGVLPTIYSPEQIRKAIIKGDISLMSSPYKDANLEKMLYNIIWVFSWKNKTTFEAISLNDYRNAIDSEGKRQASQNEISTIKAMFFPKDFRGAYHNGLFTEGIKVKCEMFFCSTESENLDDCKFLPNANLLNFINPQMDLFQNKAKQLS